MIDSVYRKDENCYRKVFLEQYNSNNNTKSYSDDSHNVDSDEEFSHDSDKKNSVKKIQMKKIKFISLFLEKASDLISIYPKMLELRGKPFQRNIRSVLFRKK